MPSILTLPKSMEEVEEAVLLPEDWYPMRLAKDPETKPNGVLREYMKERGLKNWEQALSAAVEEDYQDSDGKYPGANWVLSLRVMDEDPMVNGRSFTVWLQLPNAGDTARTNFEGRKVVDEKMERIGAHVSAFHGGAPTTGTEVVLEADMAAMFYVVQEVSFRDEDKLVNGIDGNKDPQPMA